LKRLVSAWQLRPDGTPNDHSDPSYDADVLRRFRALHHEVRPLLGSLGDLAPRLERYELMLDRAHDRIVDGQVEYIASPMIDSYHSCWFELHEELIYLCGRTRAEETAAGRA
jgi:pyruvate,orthophosphate dikinase